MGRSTTPTFRVELSVPGQRWTPVGWNSRRDGRANGTNLCAYVRGVEGSTQPGGCNAHLGAVVIKSARLIRQATGEVVANYETQR